MGFRSLKTIGESLNVSSCDQVVSLDGLEKLESDLNQLVIKDNKMLSDIQGVNNVSSITESLYIRGNLNLKACSIDLICQRIQTDNVNIGYNGDGCQNLEEVQLDCN